jgi:3-methyladenine DNA glycosylase AlkD
MLREAGKRVDADELRGFLDAYAGDLPRTTLRYAIEHLAPEVRRAYRAQPGTVDRSNLS